MGKDEKENPHMSHQDFDHDLEQGPAADWLRAQRPDVSAQDLDRIKLEAKSRAARPAVAPRRAVSTALASLVLALGLGGAFAIAGKGPPASSSAGSNSGSAAASEYRPGKGCGDKNKVHANEDECNKPPK